MVHSRSPGVDNTRLFISLTAAAGTKMLDVFELNLQDSSIEVPAAPRNRNPPPIGRWALSRLKVSAQWADHWIESAARTQSAHSVSWSSGKTGANHLSLSAHWAEPYKDPRTRARDLDAVQVVSARRTIGPPPGSWAPWAHLCNGKVKSSYLLWLLSLCVQEVIDRNRRLPLGSEAWIHC